MSPVPHPFVLLGLVATVAALGIAAIAWYQKDSPGAREYTTVMVVLAVWSTLYVVQLVQPTVPEKTPWLLARHALTPFVGILFWLFTARYTDRPELLSRRYLVPMVVVGVAIAIIVVVNPGSSYWVDLSIAVTNSLPVVDITFGPAFWLNTGYTLGLVGGGHIYIVRMFRESLPVYRPQLTAMTITGLIEFGLVAIFLSEHTALVPPVNPWPHIQLVTYGTTLASIPIGWSYVSGALFTLQPLAGQTVIENMGDPVFVFDQNNQLRYTNAAALRLLDPPGEIDPIGQSVGTVFADKPELLAQYQQAGSGGQPDSETITFVVDGETRSYDLRSSVIYTSLGSPAGTVVAARDVTDTHRQRIQLRERTEELETKKAQLEHQNKQLDRFNSFVTHDLRSPLQVASGYVHLTKKTGDLSHLSDLEQSLRRMEGMVEDLRKLTRIDQTDLTTGSVDIERAAEQAWQQVDTPNARLSVATNGEVVAEKELLLHVFENLYRNSVDHGVSDEYAENEEGSDHNEPALTVRVCRLDDGFAVEDDGQGIPESEREAVLKHGYSTASDGTGLGMSIVRTIAEAHGWAIAVTESDEGGARFEFHGVETQSPLAERSA